MGLFGKKGNKEFSIQVKHVSGLPIPQGITCQILVNNDNMQIVANGVNINLNLNKINGVSFEMDVDIEKYSKSSKLGGAIGAATFGVTGAIIGSAPKIKTERKVTGCTVISYTAQEDAGYLLFEDTKPNSLEAAKLCDKLKKELK